MGTIILRGGKHDGEVTDTPVPGIYVALDGQRYEETEEEQGGRKVFRFRGTIFREDARTEINLDANASGSA